MKLNTLIRSAIAMTLAGQAIAPVASAFNPRRTDPSVAFGFDQEDRKELAALNESSSLALNLLIATTLLEQESDKLGAADPAIMKRYENIRRSYLGAVPTSIAGGSAYYLGAESLKTVEFVIKPLTLLLRGIYNTSKTASHKSYDLMKLLRITVVIEKATKASIDASAYSVDHILRPILQALITRNTMLSSGSSSATSVFTGSMFFMMNDAKEALTFAQVRQILGQDDAVRARVDRAVEGLAPVFNLDAAKQSQLKIAIYDEVLKQAVENGFSEDTSKYNLDVVALMQKNGLVSTEIAQAVNKLRSLAATIDVSDEQTDAAQAVRDNVDMALALAAILQTKLNSGEIKNKKIAAELQRMLGGIDARLALIGFNMKK